ncbi:hypothetical protein ABBQ38_008457 [Trebouxia sp. C0009 RCD-2024]
MLTEAQQVEDMVQGFCEQVDDEEDEDESVCDMPAFNLLFEDEIDPAADPEAFDSEADEY